MSRAARLHAHGEPLAVEDINPGQPGPDEVEVELRYAGVNPVDRYIAAGSVAADGPLPRTLGNEAAGVLDGRPVVVAGEGLGTTRDGTFTTRAVVPRAAIVDVPDGVDPRQAASVGVGGLTAFSVVVSLAEVGPDDRVLVLGASGGVGLPVVSLAAGLGATVWGTTTSAAKASAIRDLGAKRVLVTQADGLADAAGDFSPTVVIDALGGPFAPVALQLLAPYGRYVIFGTSAGPQVELNLQVLYRKNAVLRGYSGFGLTTEQRRERLGQTLRALADGGMRIPVDRTVPLTSIGEAFDLLADHAVVGKVVLDLTG